MTEYNVDSSLKRLIRRGKSHTGPRTIDSLSYSYTLGRMTGLTERAATNRLSGSFEISRKGSFTYRYDTSGSLVGDSYRGISSVRYDMRGNPVFVAFDSGDETEYGYTTDGVKLWTIHRTVPGALSKETIDASKEKVSVEINCEPLRSSLLSDSPSATGTPSGVSQSSGITGRQPKGASSNGTASSVASIESPVLKVSPAELSRLSDVLVQSVDVTRYYDSYEFDDASLTEGKYYFGGGYVSFHKDGAVEYSAIVSDYRGSTRVVLSAAGNSLQKSVQQLNGYYPSGALIADYQTSHLGGTSSADVQTRKFTGKELDRMHGLDWHDFGARRYDAAAVFFTSPDPLSEKYYHINPYVYCAGNPVRFVDPDGRDWCETGSGIEWTDCKSQEEMIQNNMKGKYLGPAVVIFNGSRNEKLGKGNILGGEGGISAKVSVYGPDGKIDDSLIGYTMTSDSNIYNPIDDGEYSVERREGKGSGQIPKHYVVKPKKLDGKTSSYIRTLDGVPNKQNPKQIDKNGEGYMIGICIHTTLRDDNKVGRLTSQGCLLLDWKSYETFDEMLSPLGNGVPFTLILKRSTNEDY